MTEDILPEPLRRKNLIPQESNLKWFRQTRLTQKQKGFCVECIGKRSQNWSQNFFNAWTAKYLMWFAIHDQIPQLTVNGKALTLRAENLNYFLFREVLPMDTKH